MKQLLLLRHADSAEKMQGQTDRDRNLTRKGIAQATAVASFMKAKSLTPDRIVASSATRVRETMEVITKGVAVANQTDFVDELYEAGNDNYLNIIRSSNDCQSLLVVGHNPAITSLAAHISKTKINGVGTGNLLIFQFKGSTWAQLDKGTCELMEHFVP